MSQMIASEQVRLEQDLPELGLFKGDTGTVVSTWLYPNIAYEVEFEANGELCRRRVLLLNEQIETV